MANPLDDIVPNTGQNPLDAIVPSPIREHQATLAKLKAQNETPLPEQPGIVKRLFQKPVMEQVNETYAAKPEDSTVKAIGKGVARTILGIPSLALSAVDEATKNVQVPADSAPISEQISAAVHNASPMRVGEVVKKVLLDPQLKPIGEGVDEVVQGVKTYGEAIDAAKQGNFQAASEKANTANTLLTGGVARGSLGLTPVAGPVITNAADQISETGQIAGPVTELIGNAALLGLGAAEKGGVAKTAERADVPLKTPEPIAPEQPKAPVENVQNVQTPTFTTGDRPGPNYTSAELKAFKEKNGIANEPVQMVGQEPSPSSKQLTESPKRYEPAKPYHEMSPEELQTAYDAARADDQSALVEAFGEAGAKRYKNLDRQANSTYDFEKADKAAAEMAQMERSLTDEQYNRITNGPDPTEIRDYQRALENVDTESPEVMARSIAKAITDRGNFDEPPKRHAEKLADAQLRFAYEQAVKQGFDPRAVIEEGIRQSAKRFSDPEDAAFMLRQAVRALQPADSATPQLEVAQKQLPEPQSENVQTPNASASVTEPANVAPLKNTGEPTNLPPAEAPPASGEPLPKMAGSINLDRLKQAKTPDDVLSFIRDQYESNKEQTDAARKTGTSFEETKKQAEELGWDVKKLTSTSKTALDSREIAATNGIVKAVNEKVRAAQDAYAKSQSPLDLIRVQEALSRSAAVNLAAQKFKAESGRALNANKIFAQALEEAKTNPEKALASVQKALGDRWQETSKEVIDSLSKIDPNDTAALNRFIRNYQNFTTWDKVKAYFTANILSGVQTNVKNFAGNVSMVPLETAAKVASGRPGEAIASVQGRLAGIYDGFGAAMQILREGMTSEQMAKLELPKNYEFQGWGKAWNVPGRLLSASDAIFKTTAISGELRAQAYRIAKSEGLKGKEFKARVTELIKDPTVEMTERAVNQAKFETFTSDPGAWTKEYLRFRDNFLKVGDVKPMQLVTPFVNVPVNLLKRGIDYSPAGPVKFLLKRSNGEVPNFLTKESWKSPEARDAFGRAVVGSAVAAWAAQKYAAGELTGKAPSAAGERDAFLRNKQEYSVKIGNRWVRYTDFGPLTIPFLSVAAIGDARQINKNFDAEKVATESIGGLARGIYDQSFYKGLSDLMDVFGSSTGKFGDTVDKHAAGIAGGFVPFSGLFRSVKNVQDPTLKDPDGIYERIKAGIPWWSETVPNKLNALGQETKLSPLNGIFGFGLREDKVQNPKVEKELGRLQIAPSPANESFILSNKQFELTRDQKREYQKLLGFARTQFLDQFFNDQFEQTVGKADQRFTGTYSQMNLEQKKKAVQNLLNDAQDAAKEEFVKRVNARKEQVALKAKKRKLFGFSEDE